MASVSRPARPSLRLDAARRASLPDHPVLQWGVFALLMAGAAALIMHAGRGTTFWLDDWSFILERTGWGPYDLLRPHNEHLSVIPVVMYKLLAATVGIGDYWIYRAVLVVGLIVMAALIIVWARRHVGFWPALGLATALVLMGPAWYDLIWAFQIGFAISLAAVPVVLMALERGDRRGDAIACAAVCVSIGSSSLGLPLLAALGIEVLWRRDRLRRLWVPAIPAVLWLGWYAKYGVSTGELQNVPDIPNWIVGALTAGTSSLVALPAPYAIVLVVILAIFTARELIAPGKPSGILLLLIALPLAFFSATALARFDMGGMPTEGRYLLPSGLYVALLAVWVARGRIRSGRLAAAIFVGFLLSAVINTAALELGGNQHRAVGEAARAALTALEVNGPAEDPNFLPVPSQPALKSGTYFPAVERFGSSPAMPIEELERGGEQPKQVFDNVLAQLQRGGIAAAPRESVPARGCQTFPPPAQGETIDVPLPPSGAVIEGGTGPTEVFLRRLAPGFTGAPPIGLLAANDRGSVTLPAGGPRQWRLGLRGATPVRVCTRAG